MGIFEKLRNELVDIVEWVDDTRFTLVWRFPRYQNEIKNGAQLIVRPGQVAVFVDRGQIADVFQPGQHALATGNLPLLSTLRGWKYGFNSPFKCEVYFVSTRQVTELKWGTPNPIIMRDADFGPVRVRAFGTYALRALDPKALLRELVGTDGVFEANEVNELLRSIIGTAFADVMGKANVPVMDLAARYQQISDDLKKLVNERIDDEYGLEVPQLNIVNVSLPPEVEKAIDTRSSMGAIGDMQRYTQYQAATSLPIAAGQPGGLASAGAGLGLGAVLGQAVVGGLSSASNSGGYSGGSGAPGQGGYGAAGGSPPHILYHVAVNGQSQGPFGSRQLSEAVVAGQVSGATLVWAHGMSGWVAASQIPELASFFATPPAPPPPPVPK
ncbi:MAG: SPFH domain-containing protein [Clostridia bacterium]|nr:SPFH domain-containing protein [Deltaproteobacteria bacterium]